MPPLLDEALLAGCKQIHGGEDLKRGVAHEKGSVRLHQIVFS